VPKILVVVDPDDSEHSALNRINEISADRAEFKIDFYLESPESAKKATMVTKKMEEKKLWLTNLVQPYIERGYKIETEVVLFHRLYESIIKSAINWGAELVFKPLRRHRTLHTLIFTPTDWNLVRSCSCPLLFVTHANAIKGRPIIAAIDVASVDSAHQELNEVVLNQTKRLANVLGSDVHLVHAYHRAGGTGQNAISDPLAIVPPNIRRQEQGTGAYKLAEVNEISRENVHLSEGAADIVVNRCASEIDAGIVVIGTVARSGTAGLLIGNTAESVLEGARSDVFVVKQPNFVSPIKAA
jgi:universal stress protein E